MACDDYLRFKLVSDYGETLISQELENNLKMWLDWAHLGIGGWQNVQVPQTGNYGGDFSQLRPSNDRAFTTAGSATTAVWEGVRKDWVWETGVDYTATLTGVIASGYYNSGDMGVHLVLRSEREISRLGLASGDQVTLTSASNSLYNGQYQVVATSGTHIITDEDSVGHQGTTIDYAKYQVEQSYEPQTVSGLTINGTGIPRGEYAVDYPNGRVYLDTAVAKTATVKVAHAFRSVQVYRADDAPWFRSLQEGSMLPGDEQFLQQTEGGWAVNPTARVQMPCIVVEAIDRATTSPRDIGHGGLWVQQDVLFTIFAESRYEKNQISDRLLYQAQKTLWMFDSNELEKQGKYPLDGNGELVGDYNYPDLVDTQVAGGFRWHKCYWRTCSKAPGPVATPKIHSSIVRVTFEVSS